MKVNVEDLSKVEKRLQVEIPPEQVNKQMDKICRQIGRQVSVKGFRKGKVPKPVLKQLFKDEIIEKTIEALIKDSLPKAIEKTEFIPLLNPIIENYGELKEGDSFSYSALLDIRPDFEINPQDYQGLEIKEVSTEVSEEEVAEQIERLRRAFAEPKPAPEEHAIKTYDIAIISFKAFEGEEAIPGLESDAAYVDVGSGEFEEKIEKALLGHKVGDQIEVSVSYPETHLDPHLSGKEILYKIEIKEVYLRDLPPLEGDWLKEKLKVESVEELKSKIKEHLERDKKREAELKKIDDIMEQLRNKFEFDLPKRYIDQKVAMLLETIQTELQKKGRDLASSGVSIEKLKEKLLPQAEKQAKEEVILDKIAELEKISIDPQELELRAQLLARNYQGPPENFMHVVQTHLIPNLLREKTLQFLLSKAKFKKNGIEEVKDFKEAQENNG